MCDQGKLDDLVWLAVRLNRKVDKIMSGLSDLNTNVAQEGTDLNTLLSEWQTFLSDMQTTLAGDDPDTAVAAAATLVAAQDAQVKQLTAALQAADPAAAASASSSGTAPASGAAPAAG